MMHAIDDIERIRREGTLTYIRAARSAGHPDQSVVEYVGITLSTPSDATDRCVGKVGHPFNDDVANAPVGQGAGGQPQDARALS